MNKRRPLLSSLALLAPFAAAHAQASPPAAARTLLRFETRDVVEHLLGDTDGDGTVELLLVECGANARAGAVRRFDLAAGGGEGEATLTERGHVPLPDAAHTLFALADLLPTPGIEVVVADGRGLSCGGWQLGDEPAQATTLVRRARFDLRVDRPRRSPFVLDLNGDDRLDLMLPTLTGVRPYLQQPGDAEVPQFLAMQELPVSSRARIEEGPDDLDRETTGNINVPQIQTEDLNGDGRPDLVTRQGRVHKFHLQEKTGSFAAPIVLDLEQFVDSTPRATIDLGATLVASDRQMLSRGDINGDGIPDHVIGHRRKIWTFLADANGPQFERARTQALAEDRTAMVVVDVDDDGKADLLTFRVDVPSTATLILGLVRSTDIDADVAVYPSDGTGFERTPKYRRRLTLRVPAILSLLGRQDELIERAMAIFQKVRINSRGAFRSAPGTEDLVLVTADNKAIELFTGVAAQPGLDSPEMKRELRRLLFEDENTVFDLDRLFALLSGLFDELSKRVLGDRQSVASLALRDPEQWKLIELLVGDLDGAPGDELVAVYRSEADEKVRAYDVLAWR
ncbi:MAG: VCBS repeat-containing protein [Planctomycetes bacterium]|nr:VCBS repeat-containing protein [Planctomycetota bacterium]